MGSTPKRTRPDGHVAGFEDAAEAAASLAHLVLARACPALPSLLHLAPQVFAFLDCTKRWTFEAASTAGSVQLLRLLAKNEPLGLPLEFRKLRFLTNIEIAARKGDVDVLRWWRTCYLPQSDLKEAEGIARTAACEDHLHVLQWLCDEESKSNCSWDCDNALYVSSPEVVRWVHEHWSSARLIVLMREAAARGDLEFIKWVHHETNYSYDIRNGAMFAAVAAGHLAIVQYLYDVEPSLKLSAAYLHAIKAGHVHIIQWMLNQDEDIEEELSAEFEVPESSKFPVHLIKWLAETYAWTNEQAKQAWLASRMSEAAECGNMELLQYLYAHRHPSDRPLYIMGNAILSGNVPMAKWLHARGVGTKLNDLLFEAVQSKELAMVKWVHETFTDLKSSTSSMDEAVIISFDMVKFLHQHRSEGCTSQAMNNAAFNCDLDIVKFLHENRSEGCSKQAMDHAAARGNLDMVKFLHENRPEGCTADAMNSAAAHGHLDMVKFLQANRSEGVAAEAMNRAAAKGRLEIVQHLLECQSEISMDKALVDAASSGHLNVVEFLAHRADESQRSKAMYMAADKGHRDIVAFMSLHCQPDFDKSHMLRAATNGHLSMLQWLLLNAKEQDLVFLDDPIKKLQKHMARHEDAFYDDMSESDYRDEGMSYEDESDEGSSDFGEDDFW